MKFNLSKFSLTILTTVMLASCGSGSGGNNQLASQSKPAEQLKPTEESKPAEPSKPIEQPTPGMPERLPTNTGLAFSIKTENEGDIVGNVNTIKNEQELIATNNFTSIDVDGKNIPIDFKLEPSQDWTKEGAFIEKLNLAPHICCGKYTDVRFGAIASHSFGQDDILFYNGNPSNSMPESGDVTYKGESIMADKGNHVFGGYRKGTSEFKVNFGDKKLSGSLNVDSPKYDVESGESKFNNVKVDINADISGNKFYGTAKSSSFVSEAVSEGKFYGDGAKELGGMVKAKDNSWVGAYGAKAQ